MEIVEGYRPGAIGAIAGLHGTYYAREWGFGRFFESKVATELCAFLDRHDPATDRLFVTGKWWPRLFEIELIPQN